MAKPNPSTPKPAEELEPAAAPTDQIEWPASESLVPKWKIENPTLQLISVNVGGKLVQLKAKGSVIVQANTEDELGYDVVVKKRQKFIKVSRHIQPSPNQY